MSWTHCAWAARQKAGSPLRKLVLMMIADSTSHDNPVLIINYDRLEKLCEADKKTIQRAVKGLQDAGLLGIVERYHEGARCANGYFLMGAEWPKDAEIFAREENRKAGHVSRIKEASVELDEEGDFESRGRDNLTGEGDAKSLGEGDAKSLQLLPKQKQRKPKQPINKGEVIDRAVPGEVDSSSSSIKEEATPPPVAQPPSAAASGAPAGDRPLAGIPGPAVERQPSRPLPAEMPVGGVEEVHRAYDRGGLTGAARAEYARILASGVPHDQLVASAKLWAAVADRGMQKHFPRWLEEDLWATKPPAPLHKGKTAESLVPAHLRTGGDDVFAGIEAVTVEDLAGAFGAPLGRNQG